MLLLCTNEERIKLGEYMVIKHDGPVSSAMAMEPIVSYSNVKGEHYTAIMKMLEAYKLPNGCYSRGVVIALGLYMEKHELELTLVKPSK